MLLYAIAYGLILHIWDAYEREQDIKKYGKVQNRIY